jgi:hypothetical protein
VDVPNVGLLHLYLYLSPTHTDTLNLAMVALGILKELKINNDNVDPKICDLINEYEDKKPWVAFEYFPPRTGALKNIVVYF